MRAAIDRFLTYWSDLSLRRAGMLSACVIAALLAGLPGTIRLYGDLHTDLRELLPKGAPAALGLDELEQRLGGLSHLTLVIHSDDFAAGAKFVDALAERLRKLPPTLVARVDDRIDEEKAWFETHGALYTDVKDLQSTLDHLRHARHEAVRKANPLAVDLSDDDAAPPETIDSAVDDPEIRRGLDKLRAAFKQLDRYPNGYLAGENNQTFVIFLTPPDVGVTLAHNLEMTHAVEAVVAEVNPARYHPSIYVGYGGEIRSVIEAQEALVRDLMLSSVLVLLFVGLALLLYYRTLRAIPLLVLPLFAGVTINFAIARVLIHYLNPNTAFLGSIIVGNGINPGVILLARCFEEQRRKKPLAEAMRIALTSTWPATLCASAAAAVSYGTLMFVRFRGFNQFGLMGFYGMLLCWIATYLGMPPLVALVERFRPLPVEGKRARAAVGSFATWYARTITRAPAATLMAVGIMLAASFVGVARFARDPILYDFTKLGSRLGLRQGAASWDAHVDAVMQSYQTPTVVLTDSVEEANAVAAAARQSQAERGKASTIDSVRTLSGLLPADQPTKLILLSQLFDELTPAVIAHLPEDLRPLVQRLHDKTQLRTVSLSEVPERMQRFFHEKDGSAGKLVMVYPTLGADAHHGREEVAHAAEVRGAAHSVAPQARIAGQIVLTADIVSIISRDGLLAGAFSFLGVSLLTLIALRSLRHAFWVVGPLCLGVLWMFGALGLFGIQFNFVNFSVLPITFGIGVDYAVNLYERTRHEASVESALAASGGAVALCSATTVIGYAALLVADNQAIQSFGLTAVIGELTCLSAALFALPALLALNERRVAANTPPTAAPSTGAD